MSGIATAVVATAVIGGYTAKKGAEAATSAAGTASAAEERIAAENRLLNEQRFGEAQELLSPYISTSEAARRTLEQELGLGRVEGDNVRFIDQSQYVPGRDDIRGGQDRYSGTMSINPINPATGDFWKNSDPATSEQEKSIKQRVTALLSNQYNATDYASQQAFWESPEIQEQLSIPRQERPFYEGANQSLFNVEQPAGGQTYDGQFSVVPPEGGGAYLPAPERMDTNVIPGVQSDIQQLAPGGSAYLDAPDLLETNVIPGVQSDFGQLAPGGQMYLDPVTGKSIAADLSALAPGGNLYRDESEYLDPTQYFSDLTAGYQAFTESPIYQQMIDAGSEAALGSRAAQGLARSGGTLEAFKDVGQGVSADFFNTYMGTVGDITGINEARRTADLQSEEQRYANYLNIGEARGREQRGTNEQRFVNYMNTAEARRMQAMGYNEDRLRDVFNANEQRFANTQNISEARRREALGYNEQRDINTQNINEQRYANYLNIGEQRDINQQNLEEQRYVNYMNMLQGLSSPSTATNLASLGVNQGITMGNQASQSVANINQYNLGATAAANAARSDFAGGVGNLASAYIGSQGYGGSSGVPINQYLANTTGTITPAYAYP